MEGPREGRHLAAIMFVDMVGYSAHMQRDEAAAISAVRELWDTVRPIVAAHGGREVDLAGDGMLMEFSGALAAVRCGLDIHQSLRKSNPGKDEPVRVRAGLHLGDIEHKNGRIYGDGVNIAARVLAISPPGGIAMTPHVREQLLNVLDQAPVSLGTKAFKNIRESIEIWCLPGPDTSTVELATAREAARSDPAGHRWTFGAATFDERTLDLKVNGVAVELEKKVLDVLQFLLHHAGEVVTNEELVEGAWPGGTLGDPDLTSCIAKLRMTLGDDKQEIVKTVHGFGYRLAAPVKVEATHASAPVHFDFKAGDPVPRRPQWSIVQRLGAGGHGEVWLGRHAKTRETRVFKFALEARHVVSLKREITLFRLLHDALGEGAPIVRVLEWNLEEPPCFLEMEHLEAGSLVDWAERMGGLARIPLETRLHVAAQIADALAKAHSVGVLHKDLKPGNVLMAQPSLPLRDAARSVRDRTIKLSDFGSGGVLDAGRLEALGITRIGFTKAIEVDPRAGGTVLYLAPEVLAGQPFTIQADIYALGLILYQLIVGDLHRTLAPGWEKDIPDPLLCEDIAAAAAGNPAQRLADAAQLAQRLRTLPARHAQRAAEQAAALKAEKQQQAMRHFRIRFWWTSGLTALFGAGVIAAFAFWLPSMWVAELASNELDVIATQLEDRGELVQAEALRRTLVGYYEHFGRWNPDRGAGLHYRDGFAMLLMRRNRLADAQEQFTRLMADTADFMGPDDPHNAIFGSDYGEYLIRTGRLQAARTVLENAQPVLIKARHAGNGCVRFKVRENTERLVRVYHALGLKAEEAALPVVTADTP